MSLKALSSYTIYSRYAHYLPDKKRRETWDEITDRVFAMHERRYATQLAASEDLRADLAFAKEMVRQKRVLGSQRALQFGGKWIERAHAKLFNCSFCYIDRPRVFQEIDYVLLCGAGVGFSVQKHHVAKLPDIKHVGKTTITHVVGDSIEGWADAVGALMNSHFTGGPTVRFDYSEVRPAGTLIAGQFKAPGHKGLEQSLERIRALIERRLASEAFKVDEFAGKLRPIDAYDIIMHIGDSVLSGGIRRSATISLFSHDDAEMMAAKTGNWYIENPQRGRSNNSVLLVRSETTWDQFKAIMESTKQFGEPGFYFASSTEHGCNPCVRGDTFIRTREGEQRIDGLIGEEVEIWNGYEWSTVTPRITGENQPMLTITLADGRSLTCTYAHEWLLPLPMVWLPNSFMKVEAQKLKVGDRIWQPDGQETTVTSIVEAGVDPFVYCFTDPLRNLGTFNGIVTGQCVEIGLFPQTEKGESGFAWCNLCEINGRWCETESRFLDACRAAAILGTLQAGYTDFAYLGKVTKCIADREALLGVSITGIMDNPEVLLSPKSQRAGAAVCKETNARVAKLLGINAAARITCTKPAGSTSCVLQTASGIHPHHARRYLRRVQGNQLEFPLQHYKAANPAAVERSVWSANGTDEVISFACEVPRGAVLKNDLDATALLAKVKSSQINWVLEGENPELAVSKGIHHNISNTINVRPDEWDKVARYIYDNREHFTGISLLSSSGDLDYQQAPFATVLTPEEIVREYGDGSILASGLVVDGLHAFDGNLWAACDQALGMGTPLVEGEEPVEPIKPLRKTFKTDKAFAAALADYAIQLNLFYQAMYEWRQTAAKLDWVRRVLQFAARYYADDLRRATYCLKHVSLWHTWLTLKRTHVEVDWAAVIEETETHVAADTLAASACVGGACLV